MWDQYIYIGIGIYWSSRIMIANLDDWSARIKFGCKDVCAGIQADIRDLEDQQSLAHQEKSHSGGDSRSGRCSNARTLARPGGNAQRHHGAPAGIRGACVCLISSTGAWMIASACMHACKCIWARWGLRAALGELRWIVRRICI